MEINILFIIIMIIHKIARRTFDKILTMMAMDWKNSSSTDFSTRVTINKAILSHNFVNFIFGSYSIAITLYSASIFNFKKSNLDETDISTRPLLLKMDFPFNGDVRFVYELVLVSQLFCTLLAGCTVVMLDALLIILVSEIKLFKNILFKLSNPL